MICKRANHWCEAVYTPEGKRIVIVGGGEISGTCSQAKVRSESLECAS